MMAGRIMVFGDEIIARAQARELREGGWSVVLAGPEDGGYLLIRGQNNVVPYAEQWVIIATEAEFPAF
jgi:hypothetical protein